MVVSQKTNQLSPQGAVLVTGGASGIGRAVIDRLLADGASIVTMDRAKATHSEHERLVSFEGDVSQPADCEKAVELATTRFGTLSGVVHSAGIQRYGSVTTTSDETWNEVISINLTGAFNIARAAMPELEKSRGSIVFVGSVQSLASQQGVVAYTAAKHGLLGLARAIAMDAAPKGVRANVVAPGAVDTPMLDWAISLSDDPARITSALNKMHPLGRIAKPEEVAAVTAFLLSADASFVTGEVVRVDGGLLGQIAGSPEENT